jgi:hypothetical protein
MKVNTENFYNLTLERTIDVDFYFEGEIYLIPITFKVTLSNGSCIDYTMVSFNSTIYNQDINEHFLNQYESGKLHYAILYKLEQPLTPDDFKDTWIYSKCDMFVNHNEWMLNVWCDCKIKVVEGQFDKSNIKYDNIQVSCLVEPFSHPAIWSMEGDYRYGNEFDDDWNWIKNMIEERVHAGEFNYELAFKSFQLI